MSGFVSIHRSLLGHVAFRNDAEAMAFAWMIARAQWKAGRVRYKDRVIDLKRGQLAVSVRDMAAAMDRDKAWVERLWKRLKYETMIETASEAGVSVVTIVNYDNFQGGRDTVEAVRETPSETGARQERDTEQEDNKLNNEDAKASSPPLADRVVEAWNDGPGSNGAPKARPLDANRRKLLSLRTREHSETEVFEAIRNVGASEFHCGKNDRGWTANLGWLLKSPENFQKALEMGTAQQPRAGPAEPINLAQRILAREQQRAQA